MVKKIKGIFKTVSSDDFETDGMFPHEGETVTLKRKINVRQLLKITQARSMQGDQGSVGELAEFLHNEICPLLADVIKEWTWTDMWGEEDYGNKPTVDSLRELGLDEVMYLMNKWIEVAIGDSSTEKNPPNPSSEQ